MTRKIRTYLPYIFLCVLTIGLLLPMFYRSLIFDEQVYFYYAWMLKTGEKFYYSSWFDDKGPLIYLIYLIAFLSKSNNINIVLLKILTLIYQTITVCLFYKLASRFTSKTILVSILFAVLYFGSTFEGQYSNADNFILLPVLLAYLLFFNKRYYWSSFILGLAFMLKQNSVIEVVPLVIFVLLEQKCAIKKLIKTYVLMFLSFITPFVLFSLYCAVLGTFPTFFSIFLYDRLTTQLTKPNHEFFIRYFSQIFAQTWFLWIAALMYFAVFPYMYFKKRSELSNYMFILVWLLFSILCVIPGGNFFPHYFLILVPVLVFCLAYMVNLLPRVYAVALFVLVIVLSLYNSPYSLMRQYRSIYQHKTVNQTEYETTSHIVANYLTAVGATKTFVYDFTPALYIYSQTKPPFPYPFKFLYIDYTKVSSANIYLSVHNYEAKQVQLINMVKDGKIDYMVISAYDVVSDQEIEELKFLYAILPYFKVEKTFDRFWVYKYVGFTQPNGTSSVGVQSLNVRPDKHAILTVTRDLMLPDVSADIKCGAVNWHFPENGIDYPMTAKQSNTSIDFNFFMRGIDESACNLVVKNMDGKTWTTSFKLGKAST